MQRKSRVRVIAAGLILALGEPAAPVLATPSRHAHDARPADRVGACGVERWSVKTGMDGDAHLVNQRHVVQTNIVRLRSLHPPATLPRSGRVQPVETTVWSVDAILLRYKQE